MIFHLGELLALILTVVWIFKVEARVSRIEKYIENKLQEQLNQAFLG